MRSLAPCLTALLLLSACGAEAPVTEQPEAIGFTPDRPTLAPLVPAPRYTGADPLVLEAQATYPTGLDLHRKLVMRTCGGSNGVCHNQKEYPDMHTPASFATLLNAPCNVQPGSWSTVFDRCERGGDLLRLEGVDGADLQVGWLEYIPGDEQTFEDGRVPDERTPGLHLYLAAPVKGDFAQRWLTATFVRNFLSAEGNVESLAFASYQTTWWPLGNRQHLYGQVAEWQRDRVAALVASGLVQGDHNRNGRFGAQAAPPTPLIRPGAPEQSYLVARLRGHMEGQVVPGSRMPLANQPPSVPDMLALMCFIEGLPADWDGSAGAWNLGSGIDFENCSYLTRQAELNLVGQGVTFSGRIKPLLDASCVGCHSGAVPSGGLDLSGNTHLRLMDASVARPELKLVQPGQPEKSYLWLMLVGDGSTLRRRMPLDEQGNSVPLPQDQLDAVQTWILAGALND